MKYLGYIFSIIILLIAVILAILTASASDQQHLAKLLDYFRFFDIMLPILAVGALIKYLFTYKC